MEIPASIIRFFETEKIVMAATADKNGKINLAVKGLACINGDRGIVYIIDLYNGQTRKNLSENYNITISAVNEEKFKGCQFKGTAKEYDAEKSEEIIVHWDKKILRRISDRIITNLRRKSKNQMQHSEVHLPDVKYIIEMKVKEIIDLSGR